MLSGFGKFFKVPTILEIPFLLQSLFFPPSESDVLNVFWAKMQSAFGLSPPVFWVLLVCPLLPRISHVKLDEIICCLGLSRQRQQVFLRRWGAENGNLGRQCKSHARTDRKRETAEDVDSGGTGADCQGVPETRRSQGKRVFASTDVGRVAATSVGKVSTLGPKEQW